MRQRSAASVSDSVNTASPPIEPIALAIAVAAFPDRPLIAVALVVGPLLELPILAALAQLVRAPSTQPGTKPPPVEPSDAHNSAHSE